MKGGRGRGMERIQGIALVPPDDHFGTVGALNPGRETRHNMLHGRTCSLCNLCTIRCAWLDMHVAYFAYRLCTQQAEI